MAGEAGAEQCCFLRRIDKPGDAKTDRERAIIDAFAKQRLRRGNRLGRFAVTARQRSADQISLEAQSPRFDFSRADGDADDMANRWIDLQRNAWATGPRRFTLTFSDKSLIEQRRDIDTDGVRIHASLPVQFPSAHPTGAPEQTQDLL